MDTFDFSFYKGKKVLVTGHTGFKGSWLCRLLLKLGAEVTGYALEPPTQPDLFQLLDVESHKEMFVPMTVEDVKIGFGSNLDKLPHNTFRFMKVTEK